MTQIQQNTPDGAVYDRALKITEIFTASFWRAWYLRECGGKEVLRLAIPIIISWSSVTIMTITDRLCLAWSSQTEMNAAFQAGCLFWAFLFFPQGIGVFVNTFVAQYFGAEQHKRIGPIVWQGVYTGLFFGLFFVAATPFIGGFFRSIGQSDALSVMEQDYWKWMAIGAVAALAAEPFISFFNGIRETKIVMKITIVGFLVNMIFDPILIFGIHGHFRWGVAGAAIATSLALWVKLIAFVWCAFRRDRDCVFAIRTGTKLNWYEMKRLLRFGSMSAVQTSAEHWFYTIFVLMMGWIGEEASAATAIAYNLNALLYMPAIGLSIATAALVGNNVGANKPALASRATTTALAWSSVIAGIFSVAFLTYPQIFVEVYTARNPEGFAAAIPIANNILRIVGLYLLLDAFNLILASALRGAGDARFTMWSTIAVVSVMLALLFGGVFGKGFGVYWCWSLQVLYLICNVSIFAIRFARGKWRDKGLVESNVNLV